MKQVTLSAPGKLMLLGEHAVVYGHPCIVTAVGQRMFLTAEIDKDPNFTFEAQDVGVHGHKKPMSGLGQGVVEKNARFVELAVKNFFEYIRHAEFSSASPKIPKQVQDDKIGVCITTKSEFSSTLGFGSSSAATVCAIKALCELFSVKLTNKDLFKIAYKTVLDVQGKGSGFDVAAAIYGGTLYFVTGGKKIDQLIPPRHSGKRSRLNRESASRIDEITDSGVAAPGTVWNLAALPRMTELPLVVGYSGMKADTVTLINQVADKAKRYPKVIENIYSSIEEIVKMAKIAFLKEDWVTLGELMNFNQGYLEALGVSTDKLSAMIHAARNAGAYGAKLSGAGGGDCMISLVTSNKQQVTRAIEKAGGEVIDVETNAEGVRVEK